MIIYILARFVWKLIWSTIGLLFWIVLVDFMGEVWRWVVFGSALKVLCFSMYFSSDLDVHHYWISLTGNISWRMWYSDVTHVGTLDYPPLFAFFQLVLYWMIRGSIGLIGILPSGGYIQGIRDSMEEIIIFPPKSLDIQSIYLLRSTVVISDIVLIYSLFRYL